MASFTAMSNEGIGAVIDANEDRAGKNGESFGFSFSLGLTDFANLMYALQAAHDHAEDDATSDWAGSFASDIAQSLGVEFI